MTKDEILEKVKTMNLTNNQLKLQRAMYRLKIKQEELEQCEDDEQRKKIVENIRRCKKVIELRQSIEDKVTEEKNEEEEKRQKYLTWFNSLPLMTQAAIFIQDVKFKMPKKVTKRVQIGIGHTATVWRSYNRFAEVV